MGVRPIAILLVLYVRSQIIWRAAAEKPFGGAPTRSWSLSQRDRKIGHAHRTLFPDRGPRELDGIEILLYPANSRGYATCPARRCFPHSAPPATKSQNR